LKITNSQLKVITNNPDVNCENIISIIKSHIGKTDIICFPEMCISGYLVGDKWLNDEWVKNQILSDLKRIFTDSDIVVNSNVLDSPTITISIDWT
jgi:NAD+ synthase (glutamine-hydrolysing)